jgi:hypothetical protein
MLALASEHARRTGPIAVVVRRIRNGDKGWKHGLAPIALKLAISTRLTIEDLA